MDEADPETAAEMIGYALGRANISTLKDVKHGDATKSRSARRHLAQQVFDYIKLRGYAIIRVRPPVTSHSTGPGFTPETTDPQPSKPSKPSKRD